MGANTPALAMRTKLVLVLVSKAWRSVALQMLYEYITIRSPARANSILQVLEQSRRPQPASETVETPGPGYGQWTRHIEVFTFARGAGSINYLQVIFKILCLCPKLRILSGRWIHPLPIEFLNGVSGILGPSLSELYWNETKEHGDLNTLTTPTFLGSFNALRILDLRHFVGTDPSTWTQISIRPVLPLVRDLVISTHSRSLEIATMLTLPSLRNLTLRTPTWDSFKTETLLNLFLKVHGTSLIAIDLLTPAADAEPDPDNAIARRTAAHINPDIFLVPDLCPNLESFTFPITSPSLAPHIHPSLRRIGLRGANSDSLYPDKPSSVKGLLLAIDIKKYPKLELIQTVGFLPEAHGDSVIKDVFIWWAERFETMGVTFVDGEGVMWAYYAEPVQEERSKHLPSDSLVKSPTEKTLLGSKDKEHKRRKPEDVDAQPPPNAPKL